MKTKQPQPRQILMQLSGVLSVKTHAPPSSLLDSLSTWLDSPKLAYSFWIDSQGLEDSSKVVYIAMFGRFCQWLESKGLRLDRCDDKDIKDFLDTENPNLPSSRQNRQNKSRQKQQYVRMLERVYAHLGSLGMTGINPGRQACLKKIGGGKDQPARFLSEHERQALIALVETRIDEYRKDETRLERWVEIRDLALIGATIGAGMKPQHLQGMTLNCIRLSEGVIDNSRPSHSHRATLMPFAREALALWIEVLAELTDETLSMKGRAGGTTEQWRKSRTVFIADRSGFGFGRFATSQRMHPSTIFRRIQAFLNLAGITGNRVGAQTLRNTYVALLIEGGASNSELVTCLGLATEDSAKRLRVMVTGKRQKTGIVDEFTSATAQATTQGDCQNAVLTSCTN